MEKIPKYLSITITEIVKATEQTYDFGTDYTFKENNCCYLFYVKKGRIHLETETGIHSLATEQLVLIKNKRTVHLMVSNQTAQVIILIFRTDDLSIEQITNHYFDASDRYTALITSVYTEIKKMTFLKRTKPSMTYDKEIGEFFNLSCSLLYSFLTQLLLTLNEERSFSTLPENIITGLKQIAHPSTAEPENKSKEILYKNQLVNQIVLFMQENLNHNYSIDELAQEFFVGSANLKKIFKKETGHSIMNYFKRLKMQSAQAWVRENDLSYTEIAERLGFSSIHHFSAAFKKHTGYSPSKYYDSLQPGYVENLNNVDYILSQHPLSM